MKASASCRARSSPEHSPRRHDADKADSSARSADILEIMCEHTHRYHIATFALSSLQDGLGVSHTSKVGGFRNVGSGVPGQSFGIYGCDILDNLGGKLSLPVLVNQINTLNRPIVVVIALASAPATQG